MTFPERIDNFVRGLARKLGFGKPTGHGASAHNTFPARILICRPNHRLGNLLLITPIIQEVTSTFPGCKIDLFIKGETGQALFRNYANVDRIIQLPRRPLQDLLGYINGWVKIIRNRYDIAINVDQSSSSGRLSILLANSKTKIPGTNIEILNKTYSDYEHHAKFPVYNFWSYLEKTGRYQRERRIPALNLKLTGSEIAEGEAILKNIVGNADATICLFTFATGKKCYSKKWWSNFYDKLRNEYPLVNIIEILPLHKVAILSDRIASFYSRDIRQIGSVIANCVLFIGADSGIMHLASSVQTPTVGLFSVTDQTHYEPYSNGSMAINTNTSDIIQCFNAVATILQRQPRRQRMAFQTAQKVG